MPRRLTTEEFIEKARAVHGARYDYSQVDYVNAHTKVTIICPAHGAFAQTPTIHIDSESGCKDCAGNRQLTTETFIAKAKACHGDRYDYSHVNYFNAHAKVTIVCSDHGLFRQTARDHLNKRGCPHCAGNKQLTTEKFIERAEAVHGDRYNYSEVEYVNLFEKVTIICPEHGPFPQEPASHIHQECGCPTCGGTKQLTTETFIEKARAIHGDRYDYSTVNYVDNKTSISIICPEHGPFSQTPSNHLYKFGCGACAGNQQLTTETFIERARAIHGDRYNYSSVEYVNKSTGVTIICLDHGAFPQTPNDHLYQESGCPDCADTGFNPNEPGMLYYIAVATDDGDTRYKIGITNRAVEERFRAPDLARIRIVKTWRFAIGRSAAEREAEILHLYAGDRYFGPDILRDGNTELFTHDILGLEKQDEKDI